MKLKIALATTALMLAPTLSLAMGCSDSQKQAMSCAQGSSYDSESKTCLPVSS